MNFNSYIVSETKTAVSVPLTKEILQIKKTLKQKAFTLAETLITVSIIGVVAAITVPTLMSNMNKQIYVTGLKKTYTQLQNAVRLLPMVSGCSAGDYQCTEISANNIAELLKLAKPPYGCSMYTSTGTDALCLQTQDGAIIISANEYNSTIGVDVNGDKGPNIVGRDRFMFEIFWNGYTSPECVGFIPVGSKLSVSCTEKGAGTSGTRYWNGICTKENLQPNDTWLYSAGTCTGRVLEENAMNY